jgi:hypothetical protein
LNQKQEGAVPGGTLVSIARHVAEATKNPALPTGSRKHIAGSLRPSFDIANCGSLRILGRALARGKRGRIVQATD